MSVVPRFWYTKEYPWEMAKSSTDGGNWDKRPWNLLESPREFWQAEKRGSGLIKSNWSLYVGERSRRFSLKSLKSERLDMGQRALKSFSERRKVPLHRRTEYKRQDLELTVCHLLLIFQSLGVNINLTGEQCSYCVFLFVSWCCYKWQCTCSVFPF